jgi:hypothetical protein
MILLKRTERENEYGKTNLSGTGNDADYFSAGKRIYKRFY